jgi:FkbM family methyltransferase
MVLLDKNKIWDNVQLIATTSSGTKMLLSLKDWVQKNIFLFGYYEKIETEFWNNITKNKSVIFDVGANVGYYGLIASKKINRNGKVFGFEPVSFIYNRAAHNIFINGFKNFSLYNIALSNKIGEVKINIGNDANLGMSGINLHNYLSGKTEIVKTDTVDNFVMQNNILQIDVIKIDVEGSEWFVLNGMKDVLISLKPTILIEVLDVLLLRSGSSKEAVYDYMWSKNYNAYKIMDAETVKMLSTPESFDGLTLFKHEEIPFDDFVKVNQP